MCKISIAMATYNGAKYLKQQLDSLYSQTRIPDEIIVSDDNSCDGTIEILEEYHKKCGLIYFKNNENNGVNKNFENAIRSCSGDYIAICDQDDVWMPNKIETLYECLIKIQGDKPAVVSSQCIHIDKDGQILPTHQRMKKDTFGYANTLLISPGVIGVTRGCSLMFNRKLLNMLNRFPATELCMYDAYIGFVGASVGIKYNLAIPLMYYRHHDCNAVAHFNQFKGKLPLYKLFLYKIGLPIRSTPFPPERYKALTLIYNEYHTLFSQPVLTLYERLLDFNKEKNRWRKASILWKIKDFKRMQKFFYMLFTIIK